MLKRWLHRWGWAAMRRAGIAADLIELDDWLADVAARHTKHDADAAVAGLERFANCLVNGLRIAGPSEEQ